MNRDNSAQEDAKRLGEALVERAKGDAQRLETQAQEAAGELRERARTIADLEDGGEKTLLGAAEAIYAKEVEVGNCGVDGRGRPAGWPLSYLALRFGNECAVHLADERHERDLPPGRYRALLVFTRID